MKETMWNELKFFLSRLKSLNVSEILALNDEDFCVSVNADHENWVYCPIPKDENEVNEAVKFFRERNLSFMWPLYDSEIDAKTLERSGLLYAGDLTAMYLESNQISIHESNPAITFKRIESHEDSALWANTMWRAFGGGHDDMPDGYREFSDALMNDSANISLYLALYDDEPSGTYLTTIKGGVYYFAVTPEMRRKGIARAMMNEICRHNARIVLQSTPSGYAFYKSFGFTECFRIPVYSTETDVF